VFVGDFGLAKLLDDTTGPTRTGAWLGTVDYAAPEALAGEPAGPPADVYALGGVLYTALTGRAPYVRDTLSAVMWAHAHEPPPSLGDLGHQATDALDSAIRRAMAKDPAERFASGAELAAVLRAAVADGERPPLHLAPAIAGSADASTSAETRGASADEASTPQLPESVPAWRRRRGLLAAAAVAAAIVVAAVVLLATRGGGVEANHVALEVVPVPGTTQDIEMSGHTAWLQQGAAAVPVTGHKVGAPLPIGSDPDDMTADADNLWVVVSGGVQRFDTHTRRPVGGPIAVDVSDDSGLAVGEGGVWVADTLDDAVLRIDPGTSRPVGAPIKTPSGVDGAIAAGEGAVWVLNAEYGGSIAVTPVDPRTREVGESIRVGAYGDARALTTGGGSVWVSDPAANAIRRIDARTRKLSAQAIRLDGGATDLAMGDGAVFALDGEGETLLRIDPQSGTAVGQPVPVAAGEDGQLTADGGTALVAGGARRTLLRITW
jgi:DNA-binding beta-propeller fold protein YncE